MSSNTKAITKAIPRNPWPRHRLGGLERRRCRSRLWIWWTRLAWLEDRWEGRLRLLGGSQRSIHAGSRRQLVARMRWHIAHWDSTDGRPPDAGGVPLRVAGGLSGTPSTKDLRFLSSELRRLG